MYKDSVFPVPMRSTYRRPVVKVLRRGRKVIVVRARKRHRSYSSRSSKG
jgi:hypothetical protein